MAYKQVKIYYKQVEAQYLEMKQDAQDFDDALRTGRVSQEQFDQFQIALLRLKENYNRLSYIMFLFNTPNRKKKIARYNKQQHSLYNKVQEFSDSVILDENADILKTFKKCLEAIPKQDTKEVK